MRDEYVIWCHIIVTQNMHYYFVYLHKTVRLISLNQITYITCVQVMFLVVLTLAIIDPSTIENQISFTLKCRYCFQEQIWITGVLAIT